MSVRKETYRVNGMSCAVCAGSVETILSSQQGVAISRVNFAASTVWVEFDESETSFEMLAIAMKSAGYEIIANVDQSELEKSEKQNELHKAGFRALFSLILSIPVFVIAMFLPQIGHANTIMMILGIPVVVWFGRGFYVRAWQKAKHRTANMDTLIALGTGSALLFSIFNTLFPFVLLNQGIEPHVYYEAAAIIVSFILLGKYFEEKAKVKTSDSIKKLMELGVKTARIIQAGKEIEIPVDQLLKGDVVIIKPGEKVPVDGIVIDGNSYVDESMITGEAVAVAKKQGDMLIGATVNKNGSFLMRAERVGSETMLAQIIKLVQQAQGSKAPAQKLADKIATIFVPIVISIAIISAFVWYVFGPSPQLTYSFVTLVSVLIIACPCALGLATPTAIMVGLGKAAEKGILIKDAQSLEIFHNINAIILDKTGTLTKGQPTVVKGWYSDLYKDRDFLYQLMFSAENKSGHPLAEAIVNFLPAEIKPLELDHFESITGKGLQFRFQNHDYYMGSADMMKDLNISIPSDLHRLQATEVFVSDGTTLIAAFYIEDEIKENAKEVIFELSKSGVEVHMLTGDNETTASAVAGKLGIIKYKSQVLPEDKLNYIKVLQENGKLVAMVGDGINDSPALAQADIGVAMGTGTDIAIESAQITLLKGDIHKLNTAYKLSHETVKTIRQNLFWAFIYNIIGIPVAAGVLFPFTGFLLNPMIAGVAMSFSSVSVVMNSLRLRRFK
ncbi:MAG: copper-translocating P-type ATPase [Bacteroidales bacterium]|nr:copper-translocating P-type ATPase [Bacteroidales bacterium]